MLKLRLPAAAKNFWFILLAALVAQLILISVSTVTGDPLGDVRYTYDAWITNMLQGNYLLGLKDPWVYPYVAQAPMWIVRLQRHAKRSRHSRKRRAKSGSRCCPVFSRSISVAFKTWQTR